MAADEVQRLDLKDLDAVLERAKAEGWTELALVAGHSAEGRATKLAQTGWLGSQVFICNGHLQESETRRQGGSANSLDFSPRSITQENAEALAGIGNLSSLALWGIELETNAVVALSRLTALTRLILVGAKVDDDGAQALVRLSSLRSLILADNRIGDAGAMEISTISGLTSLDLGGNHIGDAGANALARLVDLRSLTLWENQIGASGAEAFTQLGALTSLDLSINRIDEVGAAALSNLCGLKLLDLSGNRIGDAGAAALSALSNLSSLKLSRNQIGDTGAAALSNLSGLTFLDLSGNRIGDAGALALSSLNSLTSLELWSNLIGDAGAESLSRLSGLTSLHLLGNQIGDAGARAILDAWTDPATASRRRILDLSENDDIEGLLPAEVLEQTDAQVIIAAWRQRKEEEALQMPLPPPEAAGEPVAHGLHVGTASDGRLTLVDPALEAGARDDEIGRELHAEVIAALGRLIAKARQSNVVAEWREVAEAAKVRLGAGPREVRVSAILRIERLRSLREADERRRVEPDPLVEPAEAGVAAALRDAVAAANLYIETDPYLAEQQRRLIDPEVELVLSVEEAEAAEADLEVLDVAEDALLAELRHGRETATAGGEAGRRARVWLAGSWRNVLVEVLRRVLAGIRAQARAARASAGDVALQAKLGTMITLGEAGALLETLGLQTKLAAAAAGGVAMASAARIWLSAEPEIGKGIGQAVKWGSVLLVARHLDLLPKLGWSPEFAAQIQRLLMGIAG